MRTTMIIRKRKISTLRRIIQICLQFPTLFSAVTTVRGNEREDLDLMKRIDALEILRAIEPNSTCGEDIKTLLESLSSKWALKMLDASGTVPYGILEGNTVSIGHFDECVAIADPAIDFVGQHCMADIIINNLGGSNEKAVKLRQFKGSGRANFLLPPLTLGLCLPSSCSRSEIEEGAKKIFNSSITLQIADNACRTSQPIPLSAGAWGTVAFLSVVAFIALLSTAYDLYQRISQKSDKPHPLWNSFSIYTNGKSLFQTSSRNGEMASLYGMRTLSLAWVLLCHVYMGVTDVPYQNFLYFGDNVFSAKSHLIINNGFVSVDTFLFLSGLLVCFVFFRDVSKKGSYDVPIGYLHRYLRLTPPFAVVILIQATLFPYIGDGPLWNKLNERNGEVCSENWWVGLLYVQNYVKTDFLCVDQSWYLASDMQMYWIAPFLLYPMLFWPRLAPYFLVFTVLGATFITFGVAYANDLGPSFLFTSNYVDQMNLDYFPFHTRLAPWLIGIACGYLICGIQAKKIKVDLSPKWVTAGWLFSSGACTAAIYSIAPFIFPMTDTYRPGAVLPFTTAEAASYLAFHRVAWGFGLAWIVFACVNGYGGIINTFLSWKLFQPLGKLSYCTYLLHRLVQFYGSGTKRIVQNADDYELFYSFLGLYAMTTLISIPFTLLFEIPIGNIDRYFLRNAALLPFPVRKKDILVKKDTKAADEGELNETFENKEHLENGKIV